MWYLIIIRKAFLRKRFPQNQPAQTLVFFPVFFIVCRSKSPSLIFQCLCITLKNRLRAVFKFVFGLRKEIEEYSEKMKVTKKQFNTRKCFICGMDNDKGVKAPFYEMEDKSVVSFVTFDELHQSYLGRVHGGIISAMLDEVAGRALWTLEPEAWAVTGSLNVRYFKPTPYGRKLKAVGRVTKNTSRAYVGVAELFDGDTLLARSEGTYIKLPAKTIADVDVEKETDVYIDDGVTEIDL